MEDKKVSSFLEQLKKKAKEQEHYGGKTEIAAAAIAARTCPNCGAGRALQDGVTHCAYCGFEFMSVRLTDGVHLKKENNSGQQHS
jgi:uncharacterized protein (DUF983 family)